MNSNKLSGHNFFIHTFGCQMNEYDSEHIAGILSANGAFPVDSPDKSNLIIINTCAVRDKTINKLYSLLGRYKSIKSDNDAIICIAGCVAQLQRNILLKKPYVDFVVGPDNYWKIADILSGEKGERNLHTEWYSNWHEIDNISRKNNISGYITIMEGCNNFCSYCVVPFTRGREKYRSSERIIKEASKLARNGFKEIQLLGQNVNSYLDPQTKRSFCDLLKDVSCIEGIEWIRFITSHPKDFTAVVAQTMKESEKICCQLHLPVQAGSNAVLKRMSRGYTREEYLEKIDILQDFMPDISLSTDIIVGFPGETEENFRATLKLLEKVRYSNIFSFRYSPRPLTKALQYKDSVSFQVKKKRLIQVQDLQKNIQIKKHKNLIGKTCKVLCMGKSKKEPSIYSGRNEAFQVINFSSQEDVIGKFVQVKIKDSGPYSLKGKLI